MTLVTHKDIEFGIKDLLKDPALMEEDKSVLSEEISAYLKDSLPVGVQLTDVKVDSDRDSLYVAVVVDGGVSLDNIKVDIILGDKPTYWGKNKFRIKL